VFECLIIHNETLDLKEEAIVEFQLIAPDVKLGKDVKLFQFINLYGCEIGDYTKIGAFVEIQKNAGLGVTVKSPVIPSSAKV